MAVATAPKQRDRGIELYKHEGVSWVSVGGGSVSVGGGWGQLEGGWRSVFWPHFQVFSLERTKTLVLG